MKLQTKLVVLALVGALSGAVIVSEAGAQRGPGRHHDRWANEYGQDGGWNYCPYCGGSIRERDYSDRRWLSAPPCASDLRLQLSDRSH